MTYISVETTSALGHMNAVLAAATSLLSRLSALPSLSPWLSLASRAASSTHLPISSLSIPSHPSPFFAMISGSKSIRAAVSLRLGGVRFPGIGETEGEGFDEEVADFGGKISGTARV